MISVYRLLRAKLAGGYRMRIIRVLEKELALNTHLLFTEITPLCEACA